MGRERDGEYPEVNLNGLWIEPYRMKENEMMTMMMMRAEYEKGFNLTMTIFIFEMSEIFETVKI